MPLGKTPWVKKDVAGSEATSVSLLSTECLPHRSKMRPAQKESDSCVCVAVAPALGEMRIACVCFYPEGSL